MKVLLFSAVLALALDCLHCLALPPENPMPGGYFDIVDPANDETVQKMAGFAAKERGYELVAIRAAQRAVTNGFNYKMELALKKGESQEVCIAVVWDKLYNGGQELISIKCVLQDGRK